MSFTIELAEKQQLDTQNQMLQQINAKLLPTDFLAAVETAVADFAHDPIVITSGGFDQYNRRITT